MASKTGALTRIILAKGTTFGTEVAGGANDKVEVSSLSWDESAEALIDMPIGSGQDMVNDSTRGATSPNLTIEKVARFNDAANMAMGILWGGTSFNVEAGGYYAHSFIYNGTRNRNYFSAAWDSAAGSTIAMASCTPTKVVEKYGGFPNYLTQTIEAKGDAVTYASSTNTSTTLGTATVADTVRVIAKPSDRFRLNLQTGSALANGDTYSITGAEFSFEYPVDYPKEMKGSAGNGPPISTGSEAPLVATLSITFRNMDDVHHRLFINSQNDTEYKADFVITGSTGSYKRNYFFPRLKIVEDPQYDLTGTGENPVTVKFKSLVASSAPAGMFHGYPYWIVWNTRSSAYFT